MHAAAIGVYAPLNKYNTYARELLFRDIRRFSRISASIGRNVVNRLINDFHRLSISKASSTEYAVETSRYIGLPVLWIVIIAHGHS